MKFLAITLAVAQLLVAPCVQASNGYAGDKNAPAAAVDPDHCGSPAKHACTSHGGADCVARPAAADVTAARQEIELLAIHAALIHGSSFSILNVLHDPPEKSTREVKFAWRRAAVDQDVCGDM